MSNYQNLDRDFAQMHVRDQGGGGDYPRIPPATAPKPKAYTSAPAPFKPGGTSYRPVNVVDSFPPPPSGYGKEEPRTYPPPPPPEPIGGYQYHDPDSEFPPPPPPAPSHDYSYNPGRGGSSGVYPAQAQFVHQDDYNDFGPGPMSPPTMGSARVAYNQDGRESPYSPHNSSSGNYANIRINVNPPTPTAKEFEYAAASSPPQQYRAEPARMESRQDRPLPGPQVPVGEGVRVGGGAVYYGASQVSPASDKGDKEAEVDALTNMLMKSMESANQDYFFGVCGRCEQEVTGETNGCTAMDQVYHVKCFTCVGCNVPLQGKSFFAMETKPYCESCYINTLEKCSICSKPITDRLLRATGKPYHPDCFTCVVCGKSLDGIPFTVDATNQIHCIEDFHKKFAPRCCVCQHPIMPRQGEDETIRIVAMDKSFHIECYRCEDCGLQLSSEAEGRGCYPLDDHILCKNCNAARIQAMTTKMATEL
ncbi:lipoma-preferred partner homolog [Littorina saxatilis]|uniref:LIM zinc-binding domain-containing protein n=1 Tax=Littorina saxatilis TaxID=31220 RepID=A0AAN9AUV0_9CAEN